MRAGPAPPLPLPEGGVFLFAFLTSLLSSLPPFLPHSALRKTKPTAYRLHGPEYGRVSVQKLRSSRTVCFFLFVSSFFNRAYSQLSSRRKTNRSAIPTCRPSGVPSPTASAESPNNLSALYSSGVAEQIKTTQVGEVQNDR